jgi:hypothetical protein
MSDATKFVVKMLGCALAGWVLWSAFGPWSIILMPIAFGCITGLSRAEKL